MRIDLTPETRETFNGAIAAPEKHPWSDISPQGPIFCHSCGPFSIMMEMGELLLLKISITVPSTLASKTSPSLIPNKAPLASNLFLQQRFFA